MISNYDEMSRRIYRYHGPLVISQRVCDGVIRGYQRYVLSRFEKEKQDVFFAFPDYTYGHCIIRDDISEYRKYLNISVIEMHFKRDGFFSRLSITCILFSGDNKLLFSILYHLSNFRAIILDSAK